MAFLSGSGSYQAPNLQNPATSAQAGTQYQNAQDALAQQKQLVAALQAQGGIGNQSNVYNQLQGVVNGQGPNPARALLSNATGANVANQAALMASGRGASANPGLIARQAAQAGGNLQQQAAGQAAALQAQQSLNALGQAGNIANQQVAQQQAAISGQNQFSQNEQQMILNQINAQNQAAVGVAGQQAQFTQSQNQGVGGALGGLMNAAGPALQSLGGLFGPSGAQMFLGPLAAAGSAVAPEIAGGAEALGTGVTDVAPAVLAAAHGGEIPNLKENYSRSSNPKLRAAHTSGKGSNPLSRVGQHLNMKKGGHVPGKAQKAGDHPSNDTVSAMLSPGEIVVPRTKAKQSPEEVAKFVAAVKKRHAK